MADEDWREPASLLPLTPTVLHILLALADGGEARLRHHARG